MDPVELRLRITPAGATRHAIPENAPASLCGVDASILVEMRPGAPYRPGTSNCATCIANLARLSTGHYAGRMRP